MTEPLTNTLNFNSPDLFQDLTPDLVQTFEIAAKAARAYSSTIILLGESGVGKTDLARHIHKSSPRAQKPFVVIDLSQATTSLFEDELFGHDAGAFTDARKNRKSRLEVADGGTIFLDEIGTLPFDSQAKLLRLVQDKTFRRIGGEKDITVDIRIITATSLDIREKVKRGEFREDLYHRLNVLQIHVPPLRDRPNDIIPLANHFLIKTSEKDKLPRKNLSDAAAKALLSYSWPGNVRTLENEMARATILGKGEIIQPEELSFYNPPAQIRTLSTQFENITQIYDKPDESTWIMDSLVNIKSCKLIDQICGDAKKILLLECLESADFDRDKAAQSMGCKNTTLIYRFDTAFDFDKKEHSAHAMASTVIDWKKNMNLLSPEITNELARMAKDKSEGSDLYNVVDEICAATKLFLLRKSLLKHRFVQARVCEEIEIDKGVVSTMIAKNRDLKRWIDIERQKLSQIPSVSDQRSIE